MKRPSVLASHWKIKGELKRYKVGSFQNMYNFRQIRKPTEIVTAKERKAKRISILSKSTAEDLTARMVVVVITARR
nr:hypothetical transcript [Hymenolepis microstoma]